ncbi:hypothetical protein V6N13_033755 [Hibiscus sabdariffa]
MEEVCEGKDFCFPSQEEVILSYWHQIDAFKCQLNRTQNLPEFVFYDCPPFATGLPHYGHILNGTAKDIITRYKLMTGHHVTRRFGWDCHGLPVESEIDNKLGIERRQQILDMGIDKYNEECRSIVTRYVDEWEKIVTRTGRWIDFKQDYKTMDSKYMESVWWVSSELYKNNLIAKGFKVLHYSTGCKTHLSNFEADENYQVVTDPEVMVAFPIVGDPDNAAFVAWSTTPWTLPSNLALCVNANSVYVKVLNKYSGEIYVVAESRLSELPTEKPKSNSANRPSDVAFRVIADNFVKDDSGTGIVHCAPAFGEDDYRVCTKNQIINKDEKLIVAVDEDGCFTGEIADFSGRYVKDADKDIIEAVKAKGRLVKHGTITHAYPFCWRSDTPLIYRAVPSWFVQVEKLKDQLLENNKQTYWVPSYVKDKRFHNWLETVKDWAISRSRFWGTPIPVWISEDGEEEIVVDSVATLERLSGAKVSDLHRHNIDHITIPSARGPEFGVLRHINDVFDCWFESGSMPYAYIHYPFENKELFEKNFPGDFVAEGIDQTRGWFYTLMVLSTALFKKPKNLICTGIVLAENGKKMSKRKKNYPSPTQAINDYGADALRLYLVSSPVVRAGTLNFKKDGVFDVVKGVLLPWYNAYRFLVQNAKRLEHEGSVPFVPIAVTVLQKSSNVLDQWINSATRSLVHFVGEKMDAYLLYTVLSINHHIRLEFPFLVVPYLLKFIDNLTNIYVRFNRKRLKGHTGEEDCRMALSTLYNVLLTTFSDGAEESIHYCRFPQEEGKGERIEESVTRMMRIIDLARNIRDRHNKPLKTPLREMVVVHPDEDFLDDIAGKLREYVLEELNVRSLVTCKDTLKYASVRAEPDFCVLGKRLGKSMGAVAKEVKAMSQEDILSFEKAGELVRKFKHPDGMTDKEMDGAGDGEDINAILIGDLFLLKWKSFRFTSSDVLVVLDLRQDESLLVAGIAREVVSRIQKSRKKAGLEPTDMVEVYFESLDEDKSVIQQVLNSQENYIRDAIGSPLLSSDSMPPHAVVVCEEVFRGIYNMSFKISLVRREALLFKDNAFVASYAAG